MLYHLIQQDNPLGLHANVEGNKLLASCVVVLASGNLVSNSNEAYQVIQIWHNFQLSSSPLGKKVTVCYNNDILAGNYTKLKHPTPVRKLGVRIMVVRPLYAPRGLNVKT